MNRLSRRDYVAALAAGGTLATAGCLSDDGDGQGTPIAVIDDGGFEQFEYQIDAPESGETIQFAWENHDDQEHQIVSAEPEGGWDFESQPFGEDQAVFAEFRSEGSYDIVCGIHGDPDDFENSEERMRLIIGNPDQDGGPPA